MSIVVTEAGTGDGEVISYNSPGYKGLIKEPYIFCLACFASIGGLLFGYDQGVISGVLVMSNFAKEFPSLANDATLQGWMVSILTLGAMLGALFNGPISDKFSRRWSILYAEVVFLIGSILQAAAVTVAMMFVGRLLSGLAIGMTSMVIPLYLSEIAPPNIRGSLVTLQQLGITLGIMVAFWLQYGTQYIGGTGDHQSQAAWRFPLALQCLPSLILAIGTFFLPYSPRWLMQKGREEEALETLCRLRRVSPEDHRVQSELLEIKIAQIFEERTTPNADKNQSSIRAALGPYLQFFQTSHLRKRIIIACLLQIIQQFTGINAIIYYAPQIFKAVGLQGSAVSLLATGVVGVIDFVATIPAILYMDRWGRRTVLIVGGIGMSVSQLIIATLYAVYKNSWSEHPAAGWAACAFVWVYIAHFAFSIGSVNWIIPSEIFPPSVRGKAVGLAIASNWLSNFIVALIYPRMLKSITFGTFYFFLTFCLILIVWVYFFFPETKGVSMEQMDKIFGGNSGQENLQLMTEIRNEVGLIGSNKAIKDKNPDAAHVEEVQSE